MQAITKKDVEKLLRCGAPSLIDLAVSLAGLTHKEDVAINLCGRLDMTLEHAAEQAELRGLVRTCSRDSMCSWYNSGVKKLIKAWSGLWWVKAIIDST